ncbi:MAG: sigma-70 family RNA polymerase sigma factor [Planctomycetota bacterium]
MTAGAERHDEQRYMLLITAFAPALSRLAASYASRASDQEDLFQEICLALWTALPGFRGACSERTFVYRIAHNRALTCCARRRPATCGLDAAQHAVDARPGPEQQVERSQAHEQLLGAIRSLGVGMRQVITLSLEGLTHAEIGAVLGLRENVVAVRLHRARAELRQRLAEDRS